MTYYRLALQEPQTSMWTWKSTGLTSLDAALQLLRSISRLIPPDRIRVFTSSTQEDLDELLKRENTGLASSSVTAAQFLRDNIHSCEPPPSTLAERKAEITAGQPDTVATSSSLLEYIIATASALSSECSTNMLERRRQELELGPGGDHDVPYTFALPLSMPPVLAWTRLLARVQRGELEL